MRSRTNWERGIDPTTDVAIVVTNNLLTLTVLDDPDGAPTTYVLVSGEPLPGSPGGRVGLFTWGMSGGTPTGFRVGNLALSLTPPSGTNPLANWNSLVTPRSDGTTNLDNGRTRWTVAQKANGSTGR